mmetsp:Transcript_28395/g.80145  ORF Transcript_28395/g.80145 Transcript_28395/m.80145 type:complete len:213 (+) Transcript_28395:1250-1888(+)
MASGGVTAALCTAPLPAEVSAFLPPPFLPPASFFLPASFLASSFFLPASSGAPCCSSATAFSASCPAACSWKLRAQDLTPSEATHLRPMARAMSATRSTSACFIISCTVPKRLRLRCGLRSQAASVIASRPLMPAVIIASFSFDDSKHLSARFRAAEIARSMASISVRSSRCGFILRFSDTSAASASARHFVFISSISPLCSPSFSSTMRSL